MCVELHGVCMQPDIARLSCTTYRVEEAYCNVCSGTDLRTVHISTFDDYTGCPRGNVPDFGRMFLTLKYTDLTQNTYIRS